MQKKPKVINILRDGRIVEDMSTITIPLDVYKNLMQIVQVHHQQKEENERRTCR